MCNKDCKKKKKKKKKKEEKYYQTGITPYFPGTLVKPNFI